MTKNKLAATILLLSLSILASSCGKADEANMEDNAVSIVSSDLASTEVSDNSKDTNEEEKELHVDVTDPVTPKTVKTINTNNEESVGTLECTSVSTHSHYLLHDNNNTVNFSFESNITCDTTFKLYINDVEATYPEYSHIEKGQKYVFQCDYRADSYDRVQAFVEINGQKSNVIFLDAYDVMYDEDKEEIFNAITDIESLDDEYVTDGYIDESKWDTVLSKMEDAVITLEEQGLVIFHEVSDNHIYIKFSTGVEYVYSLPQEGVKAGGKEISVYTYQPFADTKSKNHLPTKAMDDVAGYIDEHFDEIGFSQNIDDDDVNLGNISSNFARNQVIIWDGHGDYDSNFGAYVLTGQEWKSSTAGLPNVGTGWLITNDKTIAVGAGYFNQTFKKGSLDNSLVIMNACKTAQYNSTYDLCGSLNDLGATAVIGFDNTVTVGYANGVIEYTLEKMCQIDEETGDYYTAYDALCYALGAYGVDDSVNYNGIGAAPVYFGDINYRFSSAIENLNTKTIPDGKYNAALGCFGANTEDTVLLYGEYPSGNLYKANIDSNSNVLLIEAGFIDNDDRTHIIQYDEYELPLSSNYKLQAGGGGGEPMTYYVTDFNDMFSGKNDWAEGFGFTITIEGGLVTSILCWGS
jgi:hypothetical protein